MKKASELIKTTCEPVRLAFPELFVPRVPVIGGKPKGDPKFSARLVIDQSQTAVLKQLQEAIKAVFAKAWPDNDPPVNFHWPLVEAAKHYPKDPNLAGCWVINSSAGQNSPPSVVRKENGIFVKLDPQKDAGMVYSGMQAFVSVGFFSYQTTNSEGGIGCGLNAVLLTGRDVGRFDGRIAAEDAFSDVPDEMLEAVSGSGGSAPDPFGGSSGGAPDPFGGSSGGAPDPFASTDSAAGVPW